MATKSRSTEIRPYTLYKGSKTDAEEFVVDTDGLSFGIIFGECESGHYIVIPQYGVCVPAGEPNDGFYNFEQLHGCANEFVRDNAKTLAAAIMVYFEKTEESE